MIKLVNDLIVENKSGISIIPGGSILKLIKESVNVNSINGHPLKNITGDIKPEERADFDKFWWIICDNIDKAVLVKKNFKEGTTEVEGQQTDVDDWDVHSVETLDGTALFELSIPRNDINVDVSNVDDPNSQINRFLFWSDIAENTDIDDILATIAKIDFFGKHDRKNSEFNISINVSNKTNDNVLVLNIEINLSLMGEMGSIVHKGRYRTGGNYPDA